MLTSRRRSGILVVAFALLALPTCNSSSPSQTNPPGGGGGGVPVANAIVQANANNTFTPSVVNLIAGGTVTFVNTGGLHNVNSGTFRCANGCDGEGGNGAPSTDDWSFERTFPDPGSVNYVCDEHAGVGMTGTIIVQ